MFSLKNKKFIVIGLFICLTLVVVALYPMISEKTERLDPNSEPQEFMTKLLSEFYKTDYEYTKTTTVQTSDYESKSVYIGQVFNNPYKEHIVLVESSDYGIKPETDSGTKLSTDPEIYYYEEKPDEITAKIINEKGEFEQFDVERIYPFGYGEDINFTKLEDTLLEDKPVYVFQGEFTVDIGDLYDLDSELNSNVSQIYYVSKDTQQLVRIESDLTDYNVNNIIASKAVLQGTSVEVEKANYTQTNESLKQVLDINSIFKGNSSRVDTLDELKNEINEQRRVKKAKYKSTNKDIETLMLEQIFDLDEFNKYGFKQSDLNLDYYTTNTETDYSKTITREQAKKDIEALFFLLPNTYVAYNYMGGDIKFDTARNKIMEELEQVDEINLDEFCGIIIDNMSFIYDSHFGIGNKMAYDNNEEISYIKVQMVASNYLMEKDDKGYFIKSFLGKKYIVSIDGDKDFIKYISPTIDINGEIKYTITKLVDRNTILNQEEIYANIKYDNEKEENVKLQYPGETQFPQYNDIVETTVKSDVYTIKIPLFVGDNPYEFFKTAEEAKNYENVIIDIRGNSGGNGQYLIPWLETYTGLNDVERYLDREILAMSTFQRRIYPNWVYKNTESEIDGLIPNDKNLYVVYDKNVASTGEDLLKELSAMENVVMVGTNSMGCSISGNVQIYRLPETGVFCKWGNTLWLDAEYYIPEGIGIRPDIVVNDIDNAIELTEKMIEYYK